MKTLLTIAINTLEWTEGNHAWFDAKLKANSMIEVSWGDGKTSIMQTYDKESWCRVSHYYAGSEGKSHSFLITLQSEDPSALEGFVDGTWETEVEKLTIVDCPALKFLQYVQLPTTDFSRAPNIQTLVVTEYYANVLDISCLPNLKKLICRSSEIKNLDLTHNNELEELDVSYCQWLKKVSVSNASRLRIVSNDRTEIDPNSLEWLQKTVTRNGGQIQKECLHEAYISSGAYGEEI